MYVLGNNSMANSILSFPKDNSCVSWCSRIDDEGTDEEITSPEESTWTQYLTDFLEKSNPDYPGYNRTSSSASMASDAGSGPEWSHVNCNSVMNFKPKSLNILKRPSAEDESLSDTATSPVNSPKITMGIKRMHINCPGPAELTSDTNCHEKGDDEEQVMKPADCIDGVGVDPQPQGKQLAEKGLRLVSVTMFMDLVNYYHLPPRF